jgi:hypothetical protein
VFLTWCVAVAFVDSCFCPCDGVVMLCDGDGCGVVVGQAMDQGDSAGVWSGSSSVSISWSLSVSVSARPSESMSVSRSVSSSVSVDVRGGGGAGMSAEEERVTRRRCLRMGSWGDVCVYDNVCFDGRVYYFLEESGGRNITATRFLDGNGDQVGTPLGSLQVLWLHHLEELRLMDWMCTERRNCVASKESQVPPR